MTFDFRGITKSLVNLGADGVASVAVGRGRIDLGGIEGEVGSIVALTVGDYGLSIDALERAGELLGSATLVQRRDRVCHFRFISYPILSYRFARKNQH